MSPSHTDLRSWLQGAVKLGRRGWGRVHPNPLVGCVVVREGRVVGEGWHREFGGSHAEVHALEQAGSEARGATLFVSLEPCRHEGKTPPCTAAIVRAGVERVVFGAADPTAEAGGGADELREAGVEVVGPLLTVAEARAENPAFFHRTRTDQAYLALKMALSLDGRIAASPGERTPLTGLETRVRVHGLRAGFDGIVIGSGTARVDDPLLTVREDVPMRNPPVRIVLDSALGLAPDAALFRDVDTAPVMVFTGPTAAGEDIERLEAAGATVRPVPAAASGPGLDLERVLRGCRDAGIRSLLCEGGGRLARSLLDADLVERMHLFHAPVLLGECGVPGFPGAGAEDPSRQRERWVPAERPSLHRPDVETVWERARPWSHGGPGERLWEVATLHAEEA